MHTESMPDSTEIIERDPQNPDAWTCLCGNYAESDGFFPCDKDGNEIEPTIGWADLFVCTRCGRIIHQHSLQVVGRSLTPRLLT
jgi:hypothetical protein